MPFNGNGVFLRLYSWINDAANNINILATRMDNETNGIAQGLTNCITRDGQSPPTEDIPMGGFKLINLGTPTNPTDAATKAYADSLAGPIFSGPEGDSLVGHILGTTNAVATTVQAVLREHRSLKADYGAVGNGVADDTAAFSKAHADALASGGNLVVDVPYGQYKVTNTITITAPGLYFIGQNNLGCEILSTVRTGVTFNFNGVTGGGISNIKCSYTGGDPSAGAVFILLNGGTASTQFIDLRSNKLWTWFQLGATGSQATDTVIVRPVGDAFNGGQNFFYHKNHLGLLMDSPRCPVNGVATPPTDRTTNMTTVDGTTFLKFEGTCDTAQLTGGGLMEHFDHGIYIHSAGDGQVITDIEESGDWKFDYCKHQAYYVVADAGTGGIFDVKFKGYAQSWQDVGFEIVANGAVSRCVWIDPLNLVAGKQNVKFSGANWTDCGVVSDGAGVLQSGDRLNAGGLKAIDISGGNSPVFTGLKVNAIDPSSPFNWQCAYAFGCAAGINYKRISEIKAFGSTNGFLLPTETVATGSLIIDNQVQVNYAGMQTPPAVPVFASQYTNTSGNVQKLYWFSGSAVTSFVNGTRVGGAEGVLTLADGDACYFGFTAGSPPTLALQVQP